MALLPVLKYPDPRLHKVATPVPRVDDQVRALVKDMAETMYAAPGIGLAATQVDVHLRIIVIDISETRDQLRTFINPEIIEQSGEAESE
jgi:peptide deformylase